jgi:hypothetical protein
MTLYDHDRALYAPAVGGLCFNHARKAVLTSPRLLSRRMQ